VIFIIKKMEKKKKKKERKSLHLWGFHFPKCTTSIFIFCHVTPSGYPPDIRWVSWDFKALDRGHYPPKEKSGLKMRNFCPKKAAACY
jgi:hypothetical protein